MLYWDKKMSQSLFDSPGLQLPDEINKLDSNNVIHHLMSIVIEKIFQKRCILYMNTLKTEVLVLE